MAIDIVQISLLTTVILITISLTAFLLTLLRAFEIRTAQGLRDFRAQMAMVSWIWLSGEIVELAINAEPGPSLHILSMVIFSTLIILRTKSYLL